MGFVIVSVTQITENHEWSSAVRVCMGFVIVNMTQIMENHEWPSAIAEDAEGPVLEDRTSQLVHFLFPPDSIINTLKDGLKVKTFCSVVIEDCWGEFVMGKKWGIIFCFFSLRGREGRL